MIRNGEAQFVINTFSKGKQPERDGFRIRREAVENGVPCLTSLDTAEAILRVIESMNFSAEAMEQPLATKEAVLFMIKKEDCTVVSQIEIAHSIYELTLKGELVQQMNEPGQFVHIKVSNGMDPLLRRPISIAKIDQESK